MKASQCHQISFGVIPLGFPGAPLAVGINFSSQRKLGNLKGFFAKKKHYRRGNAFGVIPLGFPDAPLAVGINFSSQRKLGNLKGFFAKKKHYRRGNAFGVIPLGFEPRTHTLKVYCSTS